MPDLITYGILAALLALVFFLYLMVRRTVKGFKQGVEDSQRKRKR
ncbi:hypothetical protein [Halomicrobium salinisoli]|nr:hypothetical protein [Halomicrobium salinisoli]